MNHLHVRKSLDELLAQRGWRGRWLDTAGGPILTASFPRNPAAAGLAAVIDPEAGYVIVYVGLVGKVEARHRPVVTELFTLLNEGALCGCFELTRGSLRARLRDSLPLDVINEGMLEQLVSRSLSRAGHASALLSLVLAGASAEDALATTLP